MQGQLISPSSISISQGSPTANITGRIYRAGTTDTVTGDSFAFVARVGYGLAGTDPSTWPDVQWSSASFNTDVGGEDEYVGTFTAPAAPGIYDFAFRFFYVSGDQVWYFCDLDGSQNGFSSAQAGQLTVLP